MGILDQSVTDSQNPGAPVAEATPGTAGVTSTVTSSQVSGDAKVVDAEAKIEKLQTELKQMELDRRRQQASLQSQAAKTTQQLQSEVQAYKEQLDRIAKSKMDEKELVAYEREQLALENQKLKQTLQERDQILAQREQISTYVQAFKEYGIPEDQLDASSPEALANTGWQAMGTMIKELQAKLNGTGQQPQAKTQPQQPHQPYTGQNAAISTGKTTFADVKAAVIAKLGPQSDDQVWNLIEQGRVAPPETM